MLRVEDKTLSLPDGRTLAYADSGNTSSTTVVLFLHGAFGVGDAAASSTFLATLPPVEEQFLTGLIMDRPYPKPLALARGMWSGVEQKLLKERQTALEVQQGVPGLSAEEIARLQKEVLDLNRRLKEIARL